MNDDFSIFSGSYADLNSDGKVDLCEYLMEEMEYNDIMGEDSFDEEDTYDDDCSVSVDACDEDEKHSDDYTEENDEDTDCADCDLDKELQKRTNAENEMTEFERKYYDRQKEQYRIGDAIYDNFKAVRDNFERFECEDFDILLETIYKVDKSLGVEIWEWAIDSFDGALVNRGVSDWNSQAWCLSDRIFDSFISIDRESDDEYERSFICRYVSAKPQLEEKIYNKAYIKNHIFSQHKYIPYCVENNLRDNFLRVYKAILSNPTRREEEISKYSLLYDLIVFCSIWGIRDADPWFYAFFDKEIRSLNKPIKEAYLMKALDKEEYGRQVFAKPKKENLDLNDVYFGKSNAPENEYNNLKKENEALKFEITELEETVNELNGKIHQLETALAESKKVKEWDGKYYRYCKVIMDEFPKGLWYRTDNVTIKNDDYVYVPLGNENNEQMAKVVFIDDFRSDDLPFPLEKTKVILGKCEA